MSRKELIKVWLKYENKHTVCICERSRKMCGCKECEPDVVERDKYYGAADLFYVNKYGRSCKK